MVDQELFLFYYDLPIDFPELQGKLGDEIEILTGGNKCVDGYIF